jgi:uncharacterized membrane protein SirB2
MDLGWKILLPLSLSLVFINAIGILLSETYGEIWIWVIFPISLIAGYIAVQAINLSLRRKENAR